MDGKAPHCGDEGDSFAAGRRHKDVVKQFLHSWHEEALELCDSWDASELLAIPLRIPEHGVLLQVLEEVLAVNTQPFEKHEAGLVTFWRRWHQEVVEFVLRIIAAKYSQGSVDQPPWRPRESVYN